MPENQAQSPLAKLARDIVGDVYQTVALANLRITAQSIQDDMADDVQKWNGADFNGATLAAIHAELAATVSTLAAIIERLISEMLKIQ